MPSDDYKGFVPGALRLKGAKVQKSKKKKNKNKDSEEKKALECAVSEEIGDEIDNRKTRSTSPVAHDALDHYGDDDHVDRGEETSGGGYKTKAERDREEAQKRRMLRLMESGKAKPEMLKTHKERVEDFNTYLSKLSEHHDMPKIGPG